MTDASGSVRVAAGEALCHGGQEAKGVPVLIACLADENNPRVRLQAATALENIGEKARPALAALEKAAGDRDPYVQRAATHTVALLKGEQPSTPKPAKAAKKRAAK
jgi:HEAT repeat protein